MLLFASSRVTLLSSINNRLLAKCHNARYSVFERTKKSKYLCGFNISVVHNYVMVLFLYYKTRNKILLSVPIEME